MTSGESYRQQNDTSTFTPESKTSKSERSERRKSKSKTKPTGIEVEQVYPNREKWRRAKRKVDVVGKVRKLKDEKVYQVPKRPDVPSRKAKVTGRDSFRHIPIGHSKTMREWWESVLRNGGAIGDSVLRLTGVNSTFQ